MEMMKAEVSLKKRDKLLKSALRGFSSAAGSKARGSGASRARVRSKPSRWSRKEGDGELKTLQYKSSSPGSAHRRGNSPSKIKSYSELKLVKISFNFFRLQDVRSLDITSETALGKGRSRTWKVRGVTPKFITEWELRGEQAREPKFVWQFFAETSRWLNPTSVLPLFCLYLQDKFL
jgi:hypothetical protein